MSSGEEKTKQNKILNNHIYIGVSDCALIVSVKRIRSWMNLVGRCDSGEGNGAWCGRRLIFVL